MSGQLHASTSSRPEEECPGLGGIQILLGCADEGKICTPAGNRIPVDQPAASDFICWDIPTQDTDMRSRKVYVNHLLPYKSNKWVIHLVENITSGFQTFAVWTKPWTATGFNSSVDLYKHKLYSALQALSLLQPPAEVITRIYCSWIALLLR
jgi:hypothetical protein